ncbi:hypothetical protein Tco_0998808 [Tanacetum coccineum]
MGVGLGRDSSLHMTCGVRCDDHLAKSFGWSSRRSKGRPLSEPSSLLRTTHAPINLCHPFFQSLEDNPEPLDHIWDTRIVNMAIHDVTPVLLLRVAAVSLRWQVRGTVVSTRWQNDGQSEGDTWTKRQNGRLAEAGSEASRRRQ